MPLQIAVNKDRSQGHRDDQRAEAHLLQRQAERYRVVQSGEEKLQDLIEVFQSLKRIY